MKILMNKTTDSIGELKTALGKVQKLLRERDLLDTGPVVEVTAYETETGIKLNLEQK